MFGVKINAFNYFCEFLRNISRLTHKICLRWTVYSSTSYFLNAVYNFEKEEQLEEWCKIFDALFIFIWEIGTTESSEIPEEGESSATYINPNHFLPGVRIVYKGDRVF